MYLLITLSVLLWAVLFGTGIVLWWSASTPGPRNGQDIVRRYLGTPRHRAHRRRRHVHA